MTLTAERTPTAGVRDSLPGLLSLALASCVAVTTEMLPVGLLPQIGATFAVPDSVTGLLVSLYAVMVAALAVPLTIATSRFPRKPLLLATLASYALSNVLVAAAPTFGVVAAGRTLGGVTHALFFSLVIGYSPRLVSGAHVGRALALAGSGASVGIVVGVPLLTSLGTSVGWRASFTALAVLSAATFALVAALLPGVDHEPMSTRNHAGQRRRLAAVATSNSLVFLGHFTVYTYVSVLLLASGASPALLGPILLACGACGLLGLWYAGRGLDRNPRRTAVILVGLIGCAVIALGVTGPNLVAVVIATAVWSGAFGGVPSIYQACSVRTHAMPPELAGAWINSTANIGIAGGAAIGAGLLQTVGLSALPWPGAVLIGCGLGAILLFPKAFPRHP
ncbi:MFS transporter [Mycolicibacterium agri]|uniref:MFS transporter n=1 Tax=Mycolicibacterium agri TaxID=36811 RepID=A0A2A7N8A5_MYCAG|nr:MFS transporter [Mycolicibacterium agri]PEG39947.1 MFS transporter [Mycolicibacterium agri]GFG51447.1 MFS transporter [Mycolicibacterium agri]